MMLIKSPHVSVIIPTYNSALYLLQAIDSVLAQTYQDFEIIVVNDGSTDATAQVLTRYSDRVCTIHQVNKGLAGARNTGIQNARGEYLAFLDADDVFLPHKLAVQVDYLDQHADVGVVYSNGYLVTCNAYGGNARQLFSKVGMLKKQLGESHQSLQVLAIENAFPVHAALARRQVIQKVGAFDEQLPALEDWDLWFRVAAIARFAYLDDVVVNYQLLPTGMTKDRPRMKTAMALLQQKILDSSAFAGFSNSFKSIVAFSWGVMNLEYGDPKSARVRFEQSIEFNPKNIYARSALALTGIMGQRAAVFFHLKRWLFGTRGLPGLRD
jgi:glycosyltransferase involved in cell wall biosynthesis